MRGDPECQPVGNRECQRDHRHRQKRRDRGHRVFPIDFAQRQQHQPADDDQRRRGRRQRHKLRERGHEHGHEKQQAGDHRGQSGASADLHPGGTFDIAGNGAGARQRTDDRGHRVGHQDPVQPGNAAGVIHQPGALGHRDQSADVVEQVDKQKHEQDFDQPQPMPPGLAEHAAEIELERGAGQRSEAVGFGVKHHLARHPAEHRCRDDPDQHRRAHVPHAERGDQQEPEQRERCAASLEIAERHDRGGIAHHDAGILEPDKADKQPDAPRHCGKQRVRDHRYDQLAHPGQRQHQKRDARHQHATERHRPGHAHLLHHGKAEIGIEPHARRQRQRGVGNHPHQDRGKGCGKAGRSGNRGHRHAGLAQDRGVDEHDIGHRQERGAPRQNFGARGRAARAEREIAVECAQTSLCHAHSPGGAVAPVHALCSSIAA